ncbi:MAG: hypothetical protein AVDCRST_MAG66-1917, partial [uncultured Pseudonocardia sp.]
WRTAPAPRCATTTGCSSARGSTPTGPGRSCG